MLPACKEQTAFQSQSHTRAASGTQPGRDLFWGPENLHMSGDHWDYLQGIRPHQILARYTVSCYVRVQCGCLLQQLLLGAQIGLAHACARSFSSSCELRLSWLSQNACKDAREQEKRRKLQNTGNSIADNDSPHARKNARTILRKWFHFWVQIWDPVLASVLAPVLSIRTVVPKTGPKTAPKTEAKTGPKTGPNLGKAWIATIHRASAKHGGASMHEKYNAELRRKFFAALKRVG